MHVLELARASLPIRFDHFGGRFRAEREGPDAKIDDGFSAGEIDFIALDLR
jgi:hypothetical protein